ncbi:MAG TPA: HD domain-containing protein [Steroidobacteraceae bacterium]|nr:HD domain-containing protein [Steroidobacteraceae bacterium]
MTGTSTSKRIVGFTQMKDGTREDYELLEQYERGYLQALPDRIMSALTALQGGLGGYAVTRLEHSLQTATRAKRDGADSELIVAALIHDIGDDLAPYNHSEIAAGMLRPYVRPEVTWIVEQHGLFQSYYYAHHLGGDRNGRDQHRGHPWYQACQEFCARWDQSSFDPSYPWEPLAAFEPLVREIFLRKAWDPRHAGAL